MFSTPYTFSIAKDAEKLYEQPSKDENMLEIEHYYFAETIDDAALALKTSPGATVLGGCGYIRLGARKITTAIDLTKLGLNYVRQTDDSIEIGAMTPLRQFETNPMLNSFCGGLLAKSVSGIVGIQLRNCVTIGGTVGGRYPFSDPITALLALNAKVETVEAGLLSLEKLLQLKSFKDIVLKIVIPRTNGLGVFDSIRKSATDYAVLNTSIVKEGQHFRLAVGARPGRAVLVEDAQNYLHGITITPETAEKAGMIAAASLELGDNPRGSKAYRQAICPVLIKRALLAFAQEENHAA